MNITKTTQDWLRPWYVLCIHRQPKRDKILSVHGPFDEMDQAMAIMRGTCFLLGRQVWVFGAFNQKGRLVRIVNNLEIRTRAKEMGYTISPIYAPK